MKKRREHFYGSALKQEARWSALGFSGEGADLYCPFVQIKPRTNDCCDVAARRCGAPITRPALTNRPELHFGRSLTDPAL